MVSRDTIGILGAGSWGNTLAFLLGHKYQVNLWDYDAQRVRRVNKTRRFKRPLRQKYPDTVTITNDLAKILECKTVIIAVPLKGMKQTFEKLQQFNISKEIIFVNASKGIDCLTLKTPCELVEEFFPDNKIAVLSGPNLAKELLLGKPMVTEVAAKDKQTIEFLQEIFTLPTLRTYTSDDVKGVELCGALKNIIAIAAGSADALELGESAKASLITRGLHEMGKVLDFYGCKQETLMGPAGLGDLIATSSCNLSRNYRVGYYLTIGKKLEQIIENLGEVAEGVNTTKAIQRIAYENNLDLPIAENIFLALEGEISTVDAVVNLMKRKRKV